MAQAVSVITETPVENEVVQLSIFGEEEPRKNRKGSAPQVAVTEIHENPALKEFISSVRDADLMNMTPLQAMSLLNELKMKVKDLQ